MALKKRRLDFVWGLIMGKIWKVTYSKKGKISKFFKKREEEVPRFHGNVDPAFMNKYNISVETIQEEYMDLLISFQENVQ